MSLPDLAELYGLAKKEPRAFFSGGFSTIADAARVVIAGGCVAEWEERGDANRPRCGFLSIRDVHGTWKREPAPADVFVRDAAEAWKALSTSRALDPTYLGSLSGRVLDGKPSTVHEAIVLASAPKPMREAEALVRDAFERVRSFDVGPCPPIAWRIASTFTPASYDRSAFSPLTKPMIEGLGYGVWSGEAHEPDTWFGFGRASRDVPPNLEWVTRDFGGARQFDLAQREGVPGFADVANPYEPLLRIAWSGIGVEKVAADGVVLVIGT